MKAVVGMKTDASNEQVRGPGDEPGVRLRKCRTDVDPGDRLQRLLNGLLQLERRVNEQNFLDLAVEMPARGDQVRSSPLTGPTIGPLKPAPGGARRCMDSLCTLIFPFQHNLLPRRQTRTESAGGDLGTRSVL